MTAQPDVERLIRQTRQYEFSDGLRDLQLAILLGVGGLTAWLSFEPGWWAFIGTLIKAWGRWAAWLNMLPMVAGLLAVWGMLGLMSFLRRRWLWRESGMVQSMRWVVPRRVNVLSTAILLGGLALGLGVRGLGWGDDMFLLRMLWGATGWSFGYTLVGVGRHIGLPRYIWLGISGGLLSTAVLFVPLSFGWSSLVFGLLWGLLLGVSGLVTLRRAIRSLKNNS